MCFALGAATTEQFKHLAAAEAGPLAGLGALPGLRVLRPELAKIADGTDPLKLQQMFTLSAMLAADPVVSGVYYADDHFVPYTGAKPVAKGWNNKRGRAGTGRADTHVTAHEGRAVCFVSGEPSGLSTTLPKAHAELKKAAGPGAEIMLGFDRGGAYAHVFTHCRDQRAKVTNTAPCKITIELLDYLRGIWPISNCHYNESLFAIRESRSGKFPTQNQDVVRRQRAPRPIKA